MLSQKNSSITASIVQDKLKMNKGDINSSGVVLADANLRQSQANQNQAMQIVSTEPSNSLYNQNAQMNL